MCGSCEAFRGDVTPTLVVGALSCLQAAIHTACSSLRSSSAQPDQLNMKLTISYLTIASAISIAAATSCTHENASPWPYTEEESCDTVACAREQAYANCIAVSAVSGRTCVRPPSMLKRRVDIDCSSTETCTVSPADNSLVCLETFSGRWTMLRILP